MPTQLRREPLRGLGQDGLANLYDREAVTRNMKKQVEQ